jgi:hypothetical protein
MSRNEAADQRPKYYIESLPSIGGGDWVRARFLDQEPRPSFIAADFGAEDYCSEAVCAVNSDGSLVVLEHRTWKHEIEIKAETEGEGKPK